MTMFQASRMLSSRVVTRGMSARRPAMAASSFSSDCQAAQKLRDVLAEYRQQNFSREIPTRFRKEVFQPYVGSNGAVEVEQLNALLTNIGHPQDVLSSQEQADLLQAAGSSNRSIEVQKMMELIA